MTSKNCIAGVHFNMLLQPDASSLISLAQFPLWNTTKHLLL